MRRVCPPLLCSLAAALLLAAPVWAQISINSSPNIVGSGARALGMGGAFIAVADDATAASWNPGGLTQLERPELSLVYSNKWLGENWDETTYLRPDDDSFSVDLNDINYLSFAYPIRHTIAGRNLVFSLNYQQKYDFDRVLDFRASQVIPPLMAPGPVFVSRVHVDYNQEGRLGSLSPAFGFELTDKLSLGVVANLYDSDLVPGNEWKTRYRFKIGTGLLGGSPGYTLATRAEDFDDVEGMNYTLGLLYKPTERLSIGAVYHTPFALKLDYKRVSRTLYPPAPVNIYTSRMRLEMPRAMGLGVAYRFPNDKLTVSLDVTRRDWDDFVQVDERGTPFRFPLANVNRRGANYRRISPVTGLPKYMSYHKPTYTVRLGAEYVFVNPNRPAQQYLPSLRGGVFYDPEPASGRKDKFWTITRGDGSPDDYYGFTLGAGVLIKNRVNIDAAYQFRWGNDVRRDTFAGAWPFERNFGTDVRQHEFYLSTVIYF